MLAYGAASLRMTVILERTRNSAMNGHCPWTAPPSLDDFGPTCWNDSRIFEGCAQTTFGVSCSLDEAAPDEPHPSWPAAVASLFAGLLASARFVREADQAEGCLSGAVGCHAAEPGRPV